MDNIVLLSEIHPATTHTWNPIQQALEWYKLFTIEEAQSTLGSSPSFSQGIQFIQQRCDEQGKFLVLRDWSHIDFIGKPFIKRPYFNHDDYTICNELKNDFEIINTSTTRHPVDQLLSLNQLVVMQNQFTLRDHLLGNYQFAKKCTEKKFTRYEDFTHAPNQTLKMLCNELQLPFDPNYQHRWQQYSNITGDTDNDSTKKIDTIRPSKPITYNPKLLECCQSNQHYQQTLSLLGYSHPT